MSEKMARALCTTMDPNKVYESAGDKRKGWEWMLPQVDAILAVLEEPTNGMVAAGYPLQDACEAKDNGFWRIPPTFGSECYRAMIRAIRNGA